MTGLTRQIAAFAADARSLSLDDDITALVTAGFVDTAGVILAGREQLVVATLQRFVARHGATSPDASLLFGAGRASSRDAALLNATAGHALDYDDVAFCGHPSVVIVPALLAEGERLRRPGRDLIAAYVVGYETWAELFYREPGIHHDKGWHSTGVLGVVAAAAAVAALRRLDVETATHAIALAAGMASGLVAHFGSQAKPFQAGYAAAQGIDAVDLATLGMTGATDALEHGAGLLAALSPEGRVDRAPRTTPLGADLRLRTLRLSVKNYPMCFATHRAIDGAIALATRHAIDAATVREVTVHLGRAQQAMLRNHRPTTGVAAKFSIEFAIAAALVARRVGLAQIDDAFVARADVQALFDKVRVVPRDGQRPDQPSLSPSDRIEIALADGRTFDSGEIVYARGDAFLPLTAAEQRVKFDDCTRGTDSAELLRALESLSAIDDVRALVIDTRRQATNPGIPLALSS